MDEPDMPSRWARKYIAAACVVAGGVGLVGLGSMRVRPARPAYLPDPVLTPGAVLPGVTKDQTCDPAWTHRSRDVPESLRRAVFKAYGRNPPTAADRAGNELDHRVPVAIGGASTLANVWVQPWDGTWGARTKDRLEGWAYRAVCSGRMTLAEAQSIFLGDWQAGYLRILGPPPPPGMKAASPDDDLDPEGFDRQPSR
jgi:hypothetical protein